MRFFILSAIMVVLCYLLLTSAHAQHSSVNLYVIQVRFADPADLAMLFGGYVFQNRGGYGGSSGGYTNVSRSAAGNSGMRMDSGTQFGNNSNDSRIYSGNRNSTNMGFAH